MHENALGNSDSTMFCFDLLIELFPTQLCNVIIVRDLSNRFTDGRSRSCVGFVVVVVGRRRRSRGRGRVGVFGVGRSSLKSKVPWEVPLLWVYSFSSSRWFYPNHHLQNLNLNPMMMLFSFSPLLSSFPSSRSTSTFYRTRTNRSPISN